MGLNFIIKRQVPLISPNTFLLYSDGNNEQEIVILEEAGSQSDISSEMVQGQRSSMLPDGRAVVIGADPVAKNIEVKCFERGSTTTVDWTTEVTDQELQGYADIGVLTNGNIVAFFIDDRTPSFAILNNEGGIVKAATDADTNHNNADDREGITAIPLVQGGFCCSWKSSPGRETRASIWDGNGDNVQTTVVLVGEDPKNPIFQFGSGDIVAWDDNNADYYDSTNLTVVQADVNFSTSASTPMCGDNLGSDKLAVVWEQGSDVIGSILKDDGTVPVKDYTILVGHDPCCLLAIADDKFLLQVYNSSTEYGQSYYILNSDLSIYSGPHTAFTGLTERVHNRNVRGCYG